MTPIGRLGSAALAAGVGWMGYRYLQGRRSILGHVDDYRAHWSNPTEPDPDALHYVALGDSAAQGVGASTVSHGYVSLVAERLRQATGRPVAVTNLSFSGATSDDVVRDQLPQFAELPFTPDLVTLDIGATDVVFPGHTVATFEASLERILDALPEGAFVSDVPWFMVPGLGRQAKLMSAVAADAVGRHGHHLVALHDMSRTPGVLRYHRYTARDFFHPNDAGYVGWADAFWTAIENTDVLQSLSA